MTREPNPTPYTLTLERSLTYDLTLCAYVHQMAVEFGVAIVLCNQVYYVIACLHVDIQVAGFIGHG